MGEWQRIRELGYVAFTWAVVVGIVAVLPMEGRVDEGRAGK